MQEERCKGREFHTFYKVIRDQGVLDTSELYMSLFKNKLHGEMQGIFSQIKYRYLACERRYRRL